MPRSEYLCSLFGERSSVECKDFIVDMSTCKKLGTRFIEFSDVATSLSECTYAPDQITLAGPRLSKLALSGLSQRSINSSLRSRPEITMVLLTCISIFGDYD